MTVTLGRGLTPASAVVGAGIQPRTKAIPGQNRAEDQLCVPAVVLKGDSYRLKGKGKEVMGSESTR